MDHLTLAFGLSDIGGGEILLIGVIALLLFGKNLPTVMRNIGKAYGQFKNTLNEAKGEFTREMDNAARELEEAKREANIEKTLGDTLQDDEPKPALETGSNSSGYGSSTPGFTPPTRPPESIDQDAGPESLDKLSAAPAEAPKPPVETTAASTPSAAPAAPVEPPAPTASIPETPTPQPEASTPTPAEPAAAAEAPKPVDPAMLDQLEKKIAAPKKIPPPVS